MIRGSMAAPESIMHIMSDYHRADNRAHQPPPSMLDVALDLPPPAAVMRRSVVGPQNAFDMGPLLPGVQVRELGAFCLRNLGEIIFVA